MSRVSIASSVATLVLATAAPLAAQPHGQVRVESFFSPALGVAKHYVVYLPPSYLREGRRRFLLADHIAR